MKNDNYLPIPFIMCSIISKLRFRTSGGNAPLEFFEMEVLNPFVDFRILYSRLNNQS
ncbi:hypothetical protein C825_003875 [Parabacteroides sp. ASF519]|uniref:Uncharacterized protein n=1 Tax=Parabacteroides goldsteinii dnLKV18 TaxID=1235789 RepID=S0GJU2_9BACT|nr:hypothetical protein C803_01627 [Parabacteroides goldsteinii dnLKV18]KAI4361805.1 hypothetical protein C825_003875 [Parabacteroides sp. ASF519]